MKKFLVFLCTVTLIFSVGSVASALVIDFDDVAVPTFDGGATTGWTPLPSNYMGLTWTNVEVVAQALYAGTGAYAGGNSYGFPSAPNAAYNADGTLMATTSDGPGFYFGGGYFSSWLQNNAIQSFSSTSITVTGYLGGTAMGSATMGLGTASFAFLDPGALNGQLVDTLVFNGSGSGRWWLMDNLEITPATSPVPEPSTMLLLGTGLVGLAGFGRKKVLK